MSSMHLLFPEAVFKQAIVTGAVVSVEFSKIYVSKSLRNTSEQTLWQQPGHIHLEGVEELPELPSQGAQVTRGMVYHGAYTYLNSVELPLKISGSVGLELWLQGQETPLQLMAEKMYYEGAELEKYIKHMHD